MTDALTASDIAARRIREARQKRKWTVRELAEACDKAGAGHITAAVITNLETRRRPGREISADEVLALAWVLRVPPLQLLIPVSDGETLQVIPGEDKTALDAVAWLTDDDAALAPVWGISNPKVKREPALRTGSSPLTVLRQVRSVIRSLRHHDRAETDADWRTVIGGTETYHRNSVTVLSYRLLRLLAAMETLGYPKMEPPELRIPESRGLPVTLGEWNAEADAEEGEPDEGP